MHLLFYWEFSTSVDPLLIGFEGPPHTHNTGPSWPLLLAPPPLRARKFDPGTGVPTLYGSCSQPPCLSPCARMPISGRLENQVCIDSMHTGATPCRQMASRPRSRPSSAVSATRRPSSSLKTTYIQNTRAGELRSIDKKEPREQSAVIGGEPVSPVSRYICADTSRSKPGQGRTMPLPPKRLTMQRWRCTCTPAQAMSADAANPSRRALSRHARCGPPACSRR